MSKRIYFIVKALNSKAGGLTKSVYDRASFLSKYYDVVILTMGYQLHFKSIKKELVSLGKINEMVKIKNIFIDMSINNDKVSSFSEFEYLSLLENKSKNYFNYGKGFIRIFNEYGLYRNYIKFDKNNKIHFIDYMKDSDFSVLEKRYSFYNEKLISLDTFKNGFKNQQVIFNKNNCPILNIWHNDKGEIGRIFNMQENEVFDTTFQNIVESWLKTFIKKEDVVIFDSDFSQNTAYFKNIKCKKIVFVHSHQDYCDDTKFLKNITEIDKFVFLTQLQIDDFCNINSNFIEKSYLLPHPIVINDYNIIKDKKIVTVSRLASNKLIDIAIKAFAKVSPKYPDYIYEIYGIGPEFEKLEKLISQLGMQNKVFLRGYTNKPIDIFSKAQLSISLTKFEGFGMSILESLSVNSPVITSNVKYGPSEIIINNINGLLVDNDIDNVSFAIVKILDNPEKYQNNCSLTLEKYRKEAWDENLLSIIG